MLALACLKSSTFQETHGPWAPKGLTAIQEIHGRHAAVGSQTFGVTHGDTWTPDGLAMGLQATRGRYRTAHIWG